MKKDLRTRKVVCRFTEPEFTELTAEARRRQGLEFTISDEIRRRCFHDGPQPEPRGFLDRIRRKK